MQAESPHAQQAAPDSAASAFADGLAALVRRVVPGVERLERVSRLSGGASQETWSLTGAGAGGARKMILRRAPATQPPVVDKAPLETEAALMRALKDVGGPSPNVLHVLTPADGLGRGFLMDHVEGEALGRRIVRDEAFADARRVLTGQLGKVLAQIHALDPAKLPPLSTRTAREDFAQMVANYRDNSAPRPVYELAIRWLDQHMPAEPQRPRVAHGDFRTGNYIADAKGLAAVLDWELAHLGNPARDLGWLCVNSWRFGGIDKPVGGFGERADLLAAYAAAGGAPVSMDELLFWEVFGTLRWGTMCVGMGARAGQSDRPVELSMIGRRTSETEIDLLRLLAPRG